MLQNWIHSSLMASGEGNKYSYAVTVTPSSLAGKAANPHRSRHVWLHRKTRPLRGCEHPSQRSSLLHLAILILLVQQIAPAYVTISTTELAYKLAKVSIGSG